MGLEVIGAVVIGVVVAAFVLIRLANRTRGR
jgi:hypothetical protein